MVVLLPKMSGIFFGAAAIVARVKAEVRSGDVVVVFSNGGFDGIHGKLLEVL